MIPGSSALAWMDGGVPVRVSLGGCDMPKDDVSSERRRWSSYAFIQCVPDDDVSQFQSASRETVWFLFLS